MKTASQKSFENYHSLVDEKCPFEDEIHKAWPNASEEEKKALVQRQVQWKETQKKKINEARKNLIPEVGTPGTAIYYSDYRAVTVVRIVSPCKVVVKHNKVVCKDYFASDYEILSELNDNLGEDVFTKRRNGIWCMEGQSTKDGVLLALHYQRHHIDPSY